MATWYPSNGSSSTAISVSHFTFVMPYQPGTTSRSGKPCWGGIGAPFISYASDRARPERLGERQASLVALLDVGLDSPVEAGEDDVDRILRRRRLLRAARRAALRATVRCRPPR